MQTFNRIVSFVLFLALALGACAPASISPQEKLAPASLPTEPAPAPVKPEPVAPEEKVSLPKQIAAYASSVPVTLWDPKTHQHKLQLVDPASGQPVSGYEPIPLGANYFPIFSPDHKTLAIVTFKSDMSPAKPTLHILDLFTWQDNTFALETAGWVSSLAFNSDGTSLAIAQNYRDSNLTIFDLKAKSVIAQTPLEFMASRMKFSADSQNLMLYGPVLINRFTENERSDGPPVVALLNAIDLSMDWSVRVEGLKDGIYPTAEETQNLHQPGAAIYYFPGLAFSPVDDVLYTLPPDKDELTMVDFTGRSVKTVEIRPKLSWFERFLSLTAGVAHAKVAEGTSRSVAISSDGQWLYSVGSRSKLNQASNGELEIVQTPLNFQVIATSDGSETANIRSNASDLAISPDGKTVHARSWGGESGPWTDVFDIQSGKFVAHFEAGYLLFARRMDGTLLLVSADPDPTGKNQYRMSAYSYENGDLLGSWTVPAYGSWLTVQ